MTDQARSLSALGRQRPASIRAGSHEDGAYGRQDATEPYEPALGDFEAPNLIKRMRSLAPSLSVNNRRYERLDETGDIALSNFTGRPVLDAPISPTGPPGTDLSSLTGPLYNGIPPEYGDREELHGLEATEDALKEANGQLTGGLGRGMKSVVRQRSTTLLPSEQPLLSRSQSIFARVSRRPDRARDEDVQGQATANALGEIVAVNEPPVFDLSTAEGHRHDSFTTFEQTVSLDGSSTKQSFYFPKDPQMPDWRPWVMRYWYIASLTILAFVLAAIQEFLFQSSQEKPLLSFVDAKSINIGDYFLWKFFPTIVFVCYGVMWQAVNFEVQRTEPYFQLSQRSGALAKDSLCLDYIATPSLFLPFRAFNHGHYAVVLSSTATLLCAALVPIFQSASVTLTSDRIKGEISHVKNVRMHPVWSRLMEVTLLLTVIIGLALILQLRRKSGLISDPKGIAGIAAMAQKSHILQDFRGLDVASSKTLQRELRDRRYVLHKSSLWQGQYDPSSRELDEEAKSHSSQPLMLRAWVGVSYVVFLVVTMILVPVFTFTQAHVAVDKLPWLLTTFATIIKLLWNTLELHVRTLEPWYTLHCRNAPPVTLTLDYTGTVPGWIIFTSAMRKHYLVSVVGFCALLCELLTVCMSSFNVNGRVFITAGDDNFASEEEAGLRHGSGETLRSFWASMTLALCILAILIGVSVVVYMKRSRPFLPRQPTSIAAILAYIHHSYVLHDFVDERGAAVKRIEELDSREMTAYLESLGKTYGLGWGIGRDGQPSLGIHEEPLLGSYKPGTDWREGRVHKVGGWDEF